jgi:MFS transporter, Spinster family, sphingosine-1-phosphate transporter
MRPASSYKSYLLITLTVLLLFNCLDRIALGVVLEDIKKELVLTDTQLGFLTGLAFALFYSVMGIPIARWADRGNRVTIIALTAAVWSAAVALCGLAATFVQLLLIRVVVAVGEAGCIPPAHSLISDYFTRAERPRAFAIYGMGAASSFVVGFFLAGWLNEIYGWRMTFMLFGLPGLAVAALAAFTLREPRNEHSARNLPAQSDDVQPSFSEACVILWRNVTFRHLLLCNSVLFLFGYGILQWQPAFFIRSYGLTSSQVGLWLALTYGLGGLLGTYIGGEWATRRAAQNERLQLRAMSLAIGASGIVMVAAYLTRSMYLAFALIATYVLLLYAIGPLLNATIQGLVPPRLRAIAVAVVYLVANLIGMGLGPLATGALSDMLRPWAADESLRYALLLLSPGYLWGAWHAWRAGRSVAGDLARDQSFHEAVDVAR